MYTVSVAAGNVERVSLRDHRFDTKNEALGFIRSLGKLTTITRMTRRWIVQPAPKK